jgi:CubicO group peptidase (beta-lactamase class C family)
MFNYSNPNYMLAGLVLEKASGIPFGQYLENHIFTPLGMTRTFFARRRRKRTAMSPAQGVRSTTVGIFTPAIPRSALGLVYGNRVG